MPHILSEYKLWVLGWRGVTSRAGRNARGSKPEMNPLILLQRLCYLLCGVGSVM